MGDTAWTPGVLRRACRAPLRGWRRSTGVALLALLTACAGVQPRETPRDPLEKVNRVTYEFNDRLDSYVISPVTNTYVRITPEIVRTGISNFFDNLTYVNVILNDFFQGKVGQGLGDFWRLFFNTTLGFGGFYDIATPMGLPQHDEDLGQTFGTWGMGEGVYLVLPVFGPSSLRDAPGLAMSAVTNPLFYVSDPRIRYPAVGLEVVDLRSRVGKALRIRAAAALDPYAFTRNAYHQRRVYQIYDGHPPKPALEEEPEAGDDSSPPASPR